MGIFTVEALNGVAWIIAGVWGVVRGVEIVLEHLDTIRWKQSDGLSNKFYKILNELEEVKKERDMMLAYFFPEKTEVATEEPKPVKRGRGRPRKVRK